MPDIRPVSDLRKDFKGIERTISTSGGPIFLTSNGRPSMVVMSNEMYDHLTGGITPVLPKAEVKMIGEVIGKIRTTKEISVAEIAKKSKSFC